MPNDTAPAWPDMLTCPHCGGDELAHGFQYPPPQGTAQCYSCGAAVIADTEEEAIATWNRRTPSDQSAREAAAVAVAMGNIISWCRKQQQVYLDPRYAINQPISSFGERHALAAVIDHISALPIDTTALDRLLAEAREEGRREEREACAAAFDSDRIMIFGTHVASCIRARSTIGDKA